MSFPDRLSEAAAAYKAAEADLEKVRAVLRREIVRAREKDGATLRAIGEVLGVSRQRVREILREEGISAQPQESKKKVA